MAGECVLVTAIEILPGEGAQALHRDDSLYPLELAGVELQIGVMWALNDFTSENGGTRVVPGSHRFLRCWHRPLSPLLFFKIWLKVYFLAIGRRNCLLVAF